MEAIGSTAATRGTAGQSSVGQPWSVTVRVPARTSRPARSSLGWDSSTISGLPIAATALTRALAGTTTDPDPSTVTSPRTARRALNSKSVASIATALSEASSRTPESMGSPDRVAVAGSTAFSSAVKGFADTVSFI
jgi:hypothetical protein